MPDGMRSLPPELVLQILSYLAFDDLLTFGATCRSNYEYHIVSLKRLRLGVFEKRVHSIISLLQAGWASPDQLGGSWGYDENESYYRISVVHQQKKVKRYDPSYIHSRQLDLKRRTPTPHDKPQSQEQMIRIQNQVFARVLRRYGSSLQNIEFMAYDLNMEGATALGSSCQHTLRHLALRFEHQHIRDGLMRPSTWLHPAPANEAWNPLIGIGRFKNTGLCSLETLILERAGITPWQLMMLVRKNPNLTTLKLRTCRGARPEFLNWLGGVKNDFDETETELQGPVPGAKLEALWLEHCHRLLPHPIEEHDNALDQLYNTGLEWSLSFSESANIASELVDKANKEIWKIPQVILPYCIHDENSTIAVDPKWK
ncbi:hypothetical protein BDW59DRAFT_164066 [Aspergillus cavernicola]|uniref:F-box domain-containing protein n=1 Tax=Aspergillus cavernicola TaxID=176166 RepID=A0ABR4I326_9EURO